MAAPPPPPALSPSVNAAAAPASGLFPATPLFQSFISDANAASSEALSKMLNPLLSSVGLSGSSRGNLPFFNLAEEEALAEMLGFAADKASAVRSGADGAIPPIARVRRLAEGALYVFETAAHANCKTAVLGTALLEAGMSENAAVAFGNAWNAGSANTVSRLRTRPFGAPLVLTGSTMRVALAVGSTAFTAGREARATLDLALARSSAPAGEVEDVLSLDLNAEEVAGVLERLDAIQAQLDSLAA